MLGLLALLTIEIDIDPEIRSFGGLLLTWHGVFTAVGIAGGVALALVLGRRRGFLEDDIYSAALVAIPCAIVGARALFVVENWGENGLNSVIDIFRLNEGGITVYGAMIGGLLGGLGYGIVRKLPLRRALDVAVCALLLGMAIGRVGDIINGEHFAKPSTLPWAVRYVNIDSPSVISHPQCGLQVGGLLDTHALCAQHPAVGYEMLGDLLIVGLLLLMLLFVRREGVAAFTGLLLYSLMRFGVSELRIDSRTVIAGLTTPQVTALFIIAFSVLGLAYCLRPGEEEPEERAPAQLASATGPPR